MKVETIILNEIISKNVILPIEYGGYIEKNEVEINEGSVNKGNGYIELMLSANEVREFQNDTLVDLEVYINDHQFKNTFFGTGSLTKYTDEVYSITIFKETVK